MKVYIIEDYQNNMEIVELKKHEGETFRTLEEIKARFPDCKVWSLSEHMTDGYNADSGYTYVFLQEHVISCPDDENTPIILHDYPMLFVSKYDLETVGFDVTNVTDETMRELAESMADCYSDDEFRYHLNGCASNLDIPRNKLDTIEYLMENGSSRCVAEEYVTDSWDWDISKDDNLERFLADMKHLGVELNN